MPRLPHHATRLALAGALLASLLLAGATAVAQAAAPVDESAMSAKEIIDRALDQNGLGFYTGVATLRLTVQNGKKTEVKELVVKSRKGEGDATSSQVTLLSPAEMAGEAYLFLGRADREDDVYMYLPAFKKTRKVSGTDKKGTFLGTHLTYRDLESRDLETGSATRLTDEDVGKHACYVISSTPSADEESAYSKVTTWVRKSDYMPLRVVFYDDDGAVVKRLFSEKIATQGATTYVKKMSLHMESGGSTTVEVVEADFEASIPDRVFSKEGLGQ